MSTENSGKPAQENRLSNPASERAVLAGICKYGLDSYIEISPVITEDSFTIDYNRVLYKCLKTLLKNNTSVDFSGILAASYELGLQEFIQKTEVLKHIRGILETPVNMENVFEHAARIRRLQCGRDLQNLLRDSYKDINSINGSETLSKIFSLVEERVQNLSLSYIKEESSTPALISQKLDLYLENLIENPADIVGISSGYSAFDKAIGGGFRRKCVDVMGARTGVGKSVFCDNVALNVIRQGIPVLVLDTEMSEEDHYNRVLANMAGVEINEISTGKFSLDPKKKEKVLLAAKELKTLPYYYISVAGRPFDETLSIIKRWILKVVGFDENSRLKDCLVIYDYLKLMSSSDLGDDLQEYQMLGFQITKLHNLTVEYDFPCLTFSQLNRDGIDKESTAVMSGSDRIVWLCTSFSILKPKTEDEIATDGIMAGNRKVVVLKSRHGAGGDAGGYVCFQMEGEYARLRHLGFIKEIGRSGEFQTEEDFED